VAFDTTSRWQGGASAAKTARQGHNGNNSKKKLIARGTISNLFHASPINYFSHQRKECNNPQGIVVSL
jgi:hypothetical protein